MLIECPYCESKVDGKLLCEHTSYYEGDPCPHKVSLLECPACKNSLVSGQEYIQVAPDRYEWSEPYRLWPSPKKSLHLSLPESIRDSLDEAEKCFKCKAYDASAVMCGRVLEGICKEHKVKSNVLAGGLKELLDKGIIDKKIYEWGETLRKHRNIGAHVSHETIKREDAKDILEFAIAISDYVFVLTYKFQKFMKRKEKKKS